MLTPVFRPRGLTAGRATGWNGTAFVDTPIVFAASGDLITITAGAANQTPLSLRGHASQSANVFELVRDSDNAVGVRSLATFGFQVKTNLVVGGTDAITDDGNPRFWFYSGVSGKLLFEPSFALFASDVPLQWDSGTSISGSADTELARAAAGVVSLNDAATTGNPALAFQARSSTTVDRDRFRIVTAAVDNTDATRKYRAVFNVYDTAIREVFRVEADGSRGYLFQTVHTTAPADGLMPNSSLAFYTDGSGDLVVKLKDSGGTVRTATVDLS